MSAPLISYPPELPVSAARDEIARAIAENQVVIVAGATGSGKTTQLPKICLELGRERIAHTQPRRLAARTIAERVAEELRVPMGGLVGYKVRFTDQVSDETKIALMTDGILLNEIHRDRDLTRYDTIIIDEAHERSLNIDFLLGYLMRLLPRRPELKVIITSATIDPESFAKHFAAADGTPAPIIEVSGRTYPVEVRYRSPLDEEDEVDALVAALRELDREPPGDVLVFLPGEAEIRDAMDAVRGAYAKDVAPTEVLALYGRLSAAEQHRVFEPSRIPGVRRRVILATNVAETSLTVPGIRYVIDTGTARISRYSARSKVQRLPIEPISQASAQQRSGRAGRTSAGTAIRLYAEDDFLARDEFTDPEILRTGLASVVLQMLALGFGDIARFPFLTPPDSRGVKAALELLTELGAVSGESRLTPLGRQLARLPIEPRFARMLIEGAHQGVLGEVLPIVAGLSIQDVRERPEEQREAADRAHARFTDPTSDFLTLLNLWNHLIAQRDALGSSAFRRLCRAEFLNYVRVREWFDVHRQLKALAPKESREAGSGSSARDGRRGSGSDSRRRARGSIALDAAGSHDAHEESSSSARRADAGSGRPGAGSPRDGGAANPDLVHRALLSGLLSQIGILDERSVSRAPQKGRRPRASYLGARGVRFQVFPGSGLAKASPAAVMAAELVETSQLFARTVAVIDPAWAEALAGDLVTRSHSEPHWSSSSGAALVYEKVSLFGLDIVPRRRMQFARVDRAAARELFLRHALVEGEWRPERLPAELTAFLRANAELRRRLEKREERERRRDLLVGDEAVFAFYEARIPREVFDVRSFEAWWREALHTTPKLLTMRESDLIDADDGADTRAFPSRWVQGDHTLGLAYRFEPGAKDDGVSVLVPLPLLAGIEPAGFDWQVPGMRDELITALLRALPKQIRRNVVPAADWAAKFSEALAAEGPEHHAGRPRSTLAAALARLIQPLANQPVAASDFDLARVPEHLTVSFRAVDARGRALDSDRNLAALQRRLASRARDSVAASLERGSAPSESGAARVAAAQTLERTGLTAWDLDELPTRVDTRMAGGVVRGYPALVDEGSSVSIRVLTSEAEALLAHRGGVRRLLALGIPSAAGYVQEHLTANEKLVLATSPYSSVKALVEDCQAAVADRFLDAPVRTRADFERVRGEVSAASLDETFRLVSLVAVILDRQREVLKAVRGQNSMVLLGALNDVKEQLAGLVFPGFVGKTGIARLAQLPRYLSGALLRVQQLSENPGRDRAWMSEFQRTEAAYTEAGGTIPVDEGSPFAPARWLLEEYRVSLFAQRLGTAETVSLQRILKALPRATA